MRSLGDSARQIGQTFEGVKPPQIESPRLTPSTFDVNTAPAEDQLRAVKPPTFPPVKVDADTRPAIDRLDSIESPRLTPPPLDIDPSAAIRSVGRLKGTINASISNAMHVSQGMTRAAVSADKVSEAVAAGVSHLKTASGELITTADAQQKVLTAAKSLGGAYAANREALMGGNALLQMQLLSIGQVHQSMLDLRDGNTIYSQQNAQLKAMLPHAERLVSSHRQIQTATQRAAENMRQAAAVRVVPPPVRSAIDSDAAAAQTAQTQPAKMPTVIESIIPMASTIAAMRGVAAVEAAIHGTSVALTGVSNTAKTVYSGMQSLQGSFEVFRGAKAASKDFDAALSANQSSLQQATNSTTETLERQRQAINMSVGGYKQQAAAQAKAADEISAATNRLMSAQLNAENVNLSNATSTKILRTAFAPLGGAIKEITGAYTPYSAAVSEATAKMQKAAFDADKAAFEAAKKQYILTGALDESSSIVQRYGGAIKAAALPQRLFFRETEGAARVRAAWMTVTSALTAPLRTMSQYSVKSRSELSLLKGEMNTGQSVAQRLGGAIHSAGSALGTLTANAAKSAVSSKLVQRELQHQTQKWNTLTNDFKQDFPSVVKAFNAIRSSASAASQPINKAATAAAGYARSAVSAVAAGARWTQSAKVGQATLNGLSRASLVVYQRTRILHPVIGAVTSRLFKLKPAADAASKSIDKVGKESAETNGDLAKLAKTSGDAGSRMQSSFASSMKSIIGSKLAIGALVSGAVAWGGASAIATEQTQVQYGTLLRDMEQGKALTKEITSFSAKTPFPVDELREGTGLLLGALVPADQITARLTTLGDIAAGTKKPLNDFAKIFQKVANTDKFGLDQINQFAERGVPIYDALQSTLGVTRDELMAMVRNGELGFTEMDAALQQLTTGSGIFAGGMAAQSQTVAGLWSTLKDNVGIVLEKVVSGSMGMVKSVISGGITMAQSIGDSVTWLTQSVNEAVAITGAMLVFAWDNAPAAAELAFAEIQLSAISAFNDMGYWLTVTLPTYLEWFGDNWSTLFTDLLSWTSTVFTNLWTNIKSVMSAVWDFIKSGGSTSLEIAWTPLTEGFRSETEKLPEIAIRALTETEKGLQSQIGNLSSSLEDGFGEAMAAAMESAKAASADISLKSTTAVDTSTSDGLDPEAEKTKQPSLPQTLARDSVDTLKAIFGAQRNKLAEQQLSEQKKQTKAALNSEGYLKSLAANQPQVAEAF
ncbi:MAG: tape measure protein [Planctomycetaceae bacterium]|nr:tape measure protein [Planctomycetaceae bacterium]